MIAKNLYFYTSEEKNRLDLMDRWRKLDLLTANLCQANKLYKEKLELEKKKKKSPKLFKEFLLHDCTFIFYLLNDCNLTQENQ